MTVAASIAEWALALKASDIPEPVKRAASLHLVDGLGNALAAVRLGVADAAVAAGERLGGPEEATILGTDSRASSPAAALSNGALIQALDFDDTHPGALVHTTSVTLPAAFATGEQVMAPGAEVIAAAVAGFEAVIRLGEAVPHGFHERGFHATSVCGVFSSALVAAKLMRLNLAQTVNALGIAGSVAAGSLEFLHTGSATKPLHSGFASMNGILAARLAAAGAEGPASIFEGKYGLFRSYLGAEVRPEQITDGLGAEWKTRDIAFKLHPVCHLSLGFLDVLQQLLPQLEDPSEITKVVLQVPAASVPIICEPVETKRRPRSPYEAKFSLQYSAALLLADGSLSVESFQPSSLDRDDVRTLADRVEYEEFEFDGPPADAPSGVDVQLRDGQGLIARGVHSHRGRVVASEEQVLAKYASNTAGRADLLAEAMLTLESQPNLGFLREPA